MLKRLLFTSFLTAFSLPFTAVAADKFYWVDSNGEVVRDGSGGCVGALYHGATFPECHGSVAAEPAQPADSDGDGVTDDRDQCPGTPANTPVDAAGCALPQDSDGDGDGVNDSADSCPNTPSGSTVDSQGCAQKIVVKNLNFANNSAELSAESKAVLDGVAQSIIDNPSVDKVSVTGYTDDRGAAAYNKSLSERRARSVADYLVSQGISADKVSSQGMGEANPVADNTTAAGRRENRRVEIGLK